MKREYAFIWTYLESFSLNFRKADLTFLKFKLNDFLFFYSNDAMRVNIYLKYDKYLLADIELIFGCDMIFLRGLFMISDGLNTPDMKLYSRATHMLQNFKKWVGSSPKTFRAEQLH